MNNLDKRVDYSTLSVTLTEKQSDYANVVFIKFSQLWQRFVNSINSLLGWVFFLIPWVVTAGILWWIKKLVHK